VAAFVRVDKRHGAAWVILDRPPLNLIVPELIADLRAAVEELTRDGAVRIAVLTGAGRAFTAGMQVQVLRDLDPLSARALITSLHEAIHLVHEAPFPTVAMVNGPCLGAGFELAMACDLRVAAAGTPMGLPEVKVGAPSVIEAALLPALVGPGRAAEMLLTGESVSAEQALAWGLVNRVAPAESLERAALELVEKILACSPTAIRIQKELMVRWRKTDLDSAIRVSINAFAENYASGHGREAALAFLEKRRPNFAPRT
jgi:enoyl-CoA hydratase